MPAAVVVTYSKSPSPMARYTLVPSEPSAGVQSSRTSPFSRGVAVTPAGHANGSGSGSGSGSGVGVVVALVEDDVLLVGGSDVDEVLEVGGSDVDELLDVGEGPVLV